MTADPRVTAKSLPAGNGPAGVTTASVGADLDGSNQQPGDTSHDRLHSDDTPAEETVTTPTQADLVGRMEGTTRRAAEPTGPTNSGPVIQVAMSDGESRDDPFTVAQVLLGQKPMSVPPFVEPPYYRDLERALLRHDLVVLRGPGGTGKRTAAIQLLTTMTTDVGLLSPTMRGQRFLKIERQHHCGFVLDAASASDQPFTSYDAEVIANELKNSNSKMVLLIGPHSVTPIEVVVSAKAGADGADVLCACLRHETGERPPVDEESIRAQLRAEQVVLSPADAYALFQHMRRSTAADRLLEGLDWLSEGEASRIEENVSSLLADSDERDAALFVATLIFTGASEASITTAAGFLEERLAVLAEKEGQPMPFFGRSLTSRLERLKLCRIDAADAGVAATPTTTLSLHDPTLVEHYLQHVWFEYGLEATFSAWLADMAAVGPDASFHAGFAIYCLMTRATRSIVDSVIRPWSHHDDPLVRRAASVALGLAATNSETAQTVMLDCIHEFGRSSDWRARWTATVAAGVGVGQRFPRLGLAVLDNIADDPGLRGQGAYSLSQILRDKIDEGEGIGWLSDLLASWIKGPPRRSQRAILAASAITPIVEDPGDIFATSLVRAGIPLLTVMGVLLDIKDTRKQAQRLARRALAAIPAEVATVSGHRIIEALAADPRGRDRLDFLLRRLTRDADNATATNAAALLQEMGKG